MATERQIKEGYKVMEELVKYHDLNSNLLKYLKEGKVYYSYLVSGLFGCIDTITYSKEYEEVVKNYEKRSGAYVYHAIEGYDFLGHRTLTMLYISKEKYADDWEELHRNLRSTIAYVYDLDSKWGEIGYVTLASDNGALVRIG